MYLTFSVTYYVWATQNAEYRHSRVAFSHSFIHSSIQLIQHFMADQTAQLLLLRSEVGEKDNHLKSLLRTSVMGVEMWGAVTVYQGTQPPKGRLGPGVWIIILPSFVAS